MRKTARRAAFSLAGLAIALTFGLLACHRGAPKQRNVVIVVVSALRADALGCYGGGVETTAMDGLARQGVRFANAYANSPWAGPSFASMLTGLAPSAHGVQRLENSLPPDKATLAELLSEHGYTAGAVISDFFLGSARGFQRGFARFSQVLDTTRPSSDEVSARGCTFLEEHASSASPFCLLLHFADPAPPLMRHADDNTPLKPAGLLEGGESLDALQVASADMKPDERSFVRALYAGEVRAVDQGIGRVLAKLHELSLDQDTLVIVTSTHGFEWMDRDWIGDAHSLHDELVRVPLIVRLPGVAPARRIVNEPVSLTALVPSVLAMLGIDAGSEKLECASWLPEVRGDAQRVSPPVRFEVDFEPSATGIRSRSAHAHGVRVGDDKLVRNDRTGVLELYDLAVDPAEKVNIAQGSSARVRELSALLVKPVSVRSSP